MYPKLNLQCLLISACIFLAVECEDLNYNDEKIRSALYENGSRYWKAQPHTVIGMIGTNLSEVAEVDLENSRNFLKVILNKRNPPERKYALDCASGIGRVTKSVLLPQFEKIDLVDLNEGFLNTAKSFIGNPGKIGRYFVAGLQDFNPEENKYDLIYMGWGLSQLTDADCISFLKRCRKALKKNGIVIIKDNISKCRTLMSRRNSSFIRSLAKYLQFARESGFVCIKEAQDQNFPEKLFPIHMMALQRLSACDDPNIKDPSLTINDCQCY